MVQAGKSPAGWLVGMVSGVDSTLDFLFPRLLWKIRGLFSLWYLECVEEELSLRLSSAMNNDTFFLTCCLSLSLRGIHNRRMHCLGMFDLFNWSMMINYGLD